MADEVHELYQKSLKKGDCLSNEENKEEVDEDLENFILPDIDNWEGSIGKNLPPKMSYHRNTEKDLELWGKIREEELKARETKKNGESDLEKSEALKT
jgi:hypothetical protein